MVESWNRANAVIFHGKGGDLASNRRDEQEMSVLCLRILPALARYELTRSPGGDGLLQPVDHARSWTSARR